MDEDNWTKPDGTRRQALMKRLDKMERSGRLTHEEAERLRTAGGPAEFDAVVRDIRVRHAGTSVHVAVDQGRLSQPEADDLLGRLRKGEHSASLRSRVRGLRPGGDGARVANRGRPEGEGHEDASA